MKRAELTPPIWTWGGDGGRRGGMHDSDGMGVRGTAPAGCGAEPREENLGYFSQNLTVFLRFKWVHE